MTEQLTKITTGDLVADPRGGAVPTTVQNEAFSDPACGMRFLPLISAVQCVYVCVCDKLCRRKCDHASDSATISHRLFRLTLFS